MWRCGRPARRRLVSSCLLLVACGRAPEARGPSGTLVVALAADIAGVNELVSGGSRPTQDVLDQLFLHLFREGADPGGPPRFAPELASDLAWSPDGLVATVRLRPDVVWSDGVPVSAADVRFTWRAQTSPAVAWRYAESKERILEVEVVDPRTVRFRFASPYASRWADLNEGAILPAHVWGRLPFAQWAGGEDWFRRHLVVDGPFALAEWRPGERLLLARNPRFHVAERPRLERVVFEILPDPDLAAGRLRRGEVHYLPAIAPREARRLAANAAAALEVYPHRRYDYLAWNCARPLFAAPAARRALTLAIDRQALVEALWQGYARVAVGPIPSAVWAAHPALSPWPYDPAGAAAELERLGWRDGDGDGVRERAGSPFHFVLAVNGDNRQRLDAAVMIQEQLRRIGVEAEVSALDFNALVERLDAHDFDAALGAWGIDTSLDLSYAFHSRSIDEGYNSGGYANPEVDRLIDEVGRATSPEEIRPRLHRLQEILHEEQPYTFLWEPVGLDARSARVRGARPSSLGSFVGLEDWWLEP